MIAAERVRCKQPYRSARARTRRVRSGCPARERTSCGHDCARGMRLCARDERDLLAGDSVVVPIEVLRVPRLSSVDRSDTRLTRLGAVLVVGLRARRGSLRCGSGLGSTPRRGSRSRCGCGRRRGPGRGCCWNWYGNRRKDRSDCVGRTGGNEIRDLDGQVIAERCSPHRRSRCRRKQRLNRIGDELGDRVGNFRRQEIVDGRRLRRGGNRGDERCTSDDTDDETAGLHDTSLDG